MEDPDGVRRAFGRTVGRNEKARGAIYTALLKVCTRCTRMLPAAVWWTPTGRVDGAGSSKQEVLVLPVVGVVASSPCTRLPLDILFQRLSMWWNAVHLLHTFERVRWYIDCVPRF